MSARMDKLSARAWSKYLRGGTTYGRGETEIHRDLTKDQGAGTTYSRGGTKDTLRNNAASRADEVCWRGTTALRRGGMRARQNVVHEAGLFQGRLGFAGAVVLLEKGAEEFSNIHGIVQIRFDKGRIKETFGDVVATIRREFRKGRPNRVTGGV